MNITTEINLEKNLRYHIVKGVFDVNELSEYLKGLYNSLDSGSEMKSCWDLRDADFTSISTEDVQATMEYVSQNWGKDKTRAAFVVSRDLEYGMLRMYQTMMELNNPSEVSVFRDMSEARKWVEAG